MFYGCTSLTSISLSRANSIVNFQFYGCTSLVSVDVPLAIFVGEDAFSGCTSLSSVNMPKVETIYSGAFKNTIITKLSLPSARILKDAAFSNTRLKNVELPLAESLGSKLFEANYSLQSLRLGGGEGWAGFTSVNDPFTFNNGYLSSATLYFPANLPYYDDANPIYPSTESVTADTWTMVFGSEDNEEIKTFDISEVGHVYVGDIQIK